MRSAESEVLYLKDQIFLTNKYKPTEGADQVAYGQITKKAIKLQISKPEIFDKNLRWGYLDDSRNVTKMLKNYPNLPKLCQYTTSPEGVEKFANDTGIKIPIFHTDIKKFPHLVQFEGTKNYSLLHPDILIANDIGKIDELMFK